MARWQILDGPTQQPVGVHDDFDLFVATIENVNDPAQRRFISVAIDRTVMQTTEPHRLERDVRAAAETNGASAIERHLDDAVPPDRIAVSVNGVRVQAE